MSGERPVINYQTEALLLSARPDEGTIGVSVDKRTVWEFKAGAWVYIGISTGN